MLLRQAVLLRQGVIHRAGLIHRIAPIHGAVLVGLVLQIAGAYTNSAYELVYAFLLIVVLMLFRPNGVFVRRSAAAVRA